MSNCEAGDIERARDWREERIRGSVSRSNTVDMEESAVKEGARAEGEAEWEKVWKGLVGRTGEE